MVFVTVNMLVNVLMFAIIVGQISALVSSAARQRIQFQRVRDSVKLYLQARYKQIHYAIRLFYTYIGRS